MFVAADIDLAGEVDVRRAAAVIVVDVVRHICCFDLAEAHVLRRCAARKFSLGLSPQRAVKAAAIGKIRKAPAFLRPLGVEPPPLPLNLARCCNLKIVDVKILFRDESADQRSLFLLFGSRLHRAAIEKGDEKDRREDRSKNQYRFRFTLHAPPPILRRIAEYRPHCTRARSRYG